MMHIGFTVGKFNPPHVGHHALLQRGLQLCMQNQCRYIVCIIDTGKRTDTSVLSGEDRKQYIESWFQGSQIEFVIMKNLWEFLTWCKDNNLLPMLEISGSDRSYQRDVVRIVCNGQNIPQYQYHCLSRSDLPISSTLVRSAIVNKDYDAYHAMMLVHSPQHRLALWERFQEGINNDS